MRERAYRMLAKAPRRKGWLVPVARRVCVLVNPTAGAGRGRVWRALESRLPGSLGDSIVRLTEGPGDAERLARAEPSGLALLVVVGGDGTLHEAVNGLLARDDAPALAIIPAGTGNDFAANCGVPRDPHDAAAALRDGRAKCRQVDVGRVEFRAPDGSPRSRYFLNSLSVGVSPHANAVAHRARSILPGRWCYRLGGLTALLTRGSRRFMVWCDDRLVLDGPQLNLTAANVATFGGGLRISPGSSPFDGRLDLVAIGPLGLGRALQAFARLRSGSHVTLPQIHTTPGVRTIRVRGEGALEVETDGQNVQTEGDLVIEVASGRLTLLG